MQHFWSIYSVFVFDLRYMTLQVDSYLTTDTSTCFLDEEKNLYYIFVLQEEEIIPIILLGRIKQ